MTTDNGKRIGIEDAAARLNAAIGDLDRRRSDGLKAVAGAAAARAATLRRTRDHLAATRPGDTARIARLDAAITAADSRRTLVSAEAVAAAHAAPQVDPVAWKVYGFVRDAAHAGLAGYTVSVTFAGENKPAATATSESDGYFSLRVQPRSKKKPASKRSAAKKPELKVNAPPEPAAEPAGAPPVLRVIDPSGKTVYEEAIATAALGGIDFREVVAQG